MMPNPVPHAGNLIKFRSLLLDTQYDFIARTVRGNDYFWAPFLSSEGANDVRAQITVLPREVQVVQRLFALHEPVPHDMAVAVVGEEILGSLVALGLLSRRSTAQGPVFWAGEWQIVCYRDSFVFAKQPFAAIERYDYRLYIGELSMAFVHGLGAVEGRVLDLGCGTGILGIAAAQNRRVSHVTLIDIDEESTWASQINVLLNGLGDITTVVNGDLFGPLRGQKFDTIITSPPCTPVPESVAFPPALAGGPVGLSVVEPILRDATGFLAENGELLMILVVYGNDERLFVGAVLEDLLRQHPRIDIDLFLPGSMPTARMRPDNLIRTATLYAESNRELDLPGLFRQNIARHRIANVTPKALLRVRNGGSGRILYV